MKFKPGMKIAVFTKNHRQYLEEAAERNATNRVRPTTFRSRQTWASAQKANNEFGTLKIYFALVGGKNTIEYRADLNVVYLKPQPGNPETDEILGCELESTKGEGLWEKDGQIGVETLYLISRCERLAQPFPITELRKVQDGEPIHKDFGYSYAIVFEHELINVPDFEVHPEEVAEPAEYVEGATRNVSVNVYERSSAARKACIDHFGCVCAVCGFDFTQAYGPWGQGFIHVHHIKPLAQVVREYKVDPVRDLRPVCPNCHAMIHKGDPVLTIKQLKNKLERNRR
jgi:hypothetical protein